MTALHIAIQNGHTEVVEKMTLTYKMEKDDLNARDDVRMALCTLVVSKCKLILAIMYNTSKYACI